jgi:hypothetical protein
MFSSHLIALEQLWRSCCHGRPMPRWSDLTVEKLRDWMDRIAICDVELDPLRFRLRSVGKVIAEYDGQDFTGCYLDDILPPGLRPHVLGQWTRCLEERQPVFVHYTNDTAWREPVVIDKIFLPVSADGEQVSDVMVHVETNCGWMAGLGRQTLQSFEHDGTSVVVVGRDGPGAEIG